MSFFSDDDPPQPRQFPLVLPRIHVRQICTPLAYYYHHYLSLYPPLSYSPVIVQYEVQTAQAETNPSSISVDGHHLLLDTVYVSSSSLLEVEAVEVLAVVAIVDCVWSRPRRTTRRRHC